MTGEPLSHAGEVGVASDPTGGTPGLVSVVMAAYNCAPYVEAAIASVLAQTYPHLELHVVDDGSTDDTALRVARFLSDPRVRYHYQPNQGQTAAKNHGIRHSRGEFIGFCDADDLWLPDKLAIELPAFAGRPRVGVVYSRSTQVDQHGTPLPRDTSDEPAYPSGIVTRELFKLNFVPFGTAIVRRTCLEELGPFDERYRMSIDWELWLRISVHYEFVYVDAETYVYRVWPGQMSRNWHGRYEHAFRIMKEFVARHPGLITPAVAKEAWAHCYSQRARLRLFISHEYFNALRDIARALLIKPNYRTAWRMLPVLVLAAAGVRRA